MRTGNPGHLKSFDYLGPHRYFLTFCVDQRLPTFTTWDRVDLVMRQFLRAAADEDMDISAYCFMPDHTHVLVEGRTERSDCRAFIKGAKQLSGYHYKQAFGRRLWQRYGYERVLRDDEGTLSVARYIVENPMRAGLVERVQEYPFLGSTYGMEAVLEAAQMRPTWR